MLDIKVNNGDLLYILRYELSNFYNMPVNQIGFNAHVNTLGKNKKLTHFNTPSTLGFPSFITLFPSL